MVLLSCHLLTTAYCTSNSFIDPLDDFLGVTHFVNDRLITVITAEAVEKKKNNRGYCEDMGIAIYRYY